MMASRNKKDGPRLWNNNASSDMAEKNKPLFVLINRETASAAEITTKALKDAGRAVLIGDTTYGKGIAQWPNELADGSIFYSTQTVTVDNDGKSYHQQGITPDIHIPFLAMDYAWEGELQKVVTPDVTKIKRTFIQPTNYYRINEAAIATANEKLNWLKQHDQLMNTYFKAHQYLESFRKLPTLPLNLQKFIEVADQFKEASREAESLGGQVNSKTFPANGFATDLSLYLAAEYLKADAIAREAKQKTKEASP